MNTEKLEPLRQIINLQTGSVNPNSESPHDNELHLDMQGLEESRAEFIQVEGTISPDSSLTVSNTDQEELPEQKEVSIKEVLADPKVKEMAAFNAKMIEEKMRGNWFTIDQLSKCGFKDFMAAMDVMNLLCLYGLAYRKEIIKGTLKYKITFTNEQRREFLESELAEAEANVERIKKQIASISNKVAEN